MALLGVFGTDGVAIKIDHKRRERRRFELQSTTATGERDGRRSKNSFFFFLIFRGEIARR